jgi:hypothetical protein
MTMQYREFSGGPGVFIYHREFSRRRVRDVN